MYPDIVPNEIVKSKIKKILKAAIERREKNKTKHQTL